MIASTNDAYCPTLRPLTASVLPDGVNAISGSCSTACR
jgi:formylmethanofuran:tetrahydromethanopterin formyltransferase